MIFERFRSATCVVGRFDGTTSTEISLHGGGDSHRSPEARWINAPRTMSSSGAACPIDSVSLNTKTS